MAVSFFDKAVSIQPPNGHAEPYPLLLGPNWQPNDVRLLMVSASGIHDAGATSSMMPMDDDPPATFSTAYAMASGLTEGVYYRRLVSGDADSAVAWPKPKSGWRHFVWATLTARGVDPTVAPTGGHLTVTHIAGTGVATVPSVTVPAAGVMTFCLGTVPDPGSGGLWPAWSVPIGIPTGWTHLVATDKSGDTYFEHDTGNHIAVFAKKYAAAGSTGAVTVPIGKGGAAFAGLYCFVRAAQNVTVNVGAA